MVSDDIVTRLRKKLVMEALGDKATYITLGDCLDAADEIERLRADRDLWRHRAEEYFYTDPDCECPLCDQVREAINGNR